VNEKGNPLIGVTIHQAGSYNSKTATPSATLASQDAGNVFRGNCNNSKTKGIYWTDAILGTTIPLASEWVMTQHLDKQKKNIWTLLT
jgi:hypothetical protein